MMRRTSQQQRLLLVLTACNNCFGKKTWLLVEQQQQKHLDSSSSIVLLMNSFNTPKLSYHTNNNPMNNTTSVNHQQQQHEGMNGFNTNNHHHHYDIKNHPTTTNISDPQQVRVSQEEHKEHQPFISQLILGGASGFVGKQLLKHILSPNSQKIKVPFSDQLSKLSQVTVLSRRPDETRQILEQQCPFHNWERKESIQVQIKDWKDLNQVTTEKDPLFLFKHQVCDIRETFDSSNKKVAAVNLSGASVGEKKWTPEYKQEIISSRVESTQHLMQHLNSFGDSASVFIGTSAVGYYPSIPDLSPHAQIYTEYNCPQAADNPLGEVTKAVEDTISQTNFENIKKRIILRPGAVIGKNGGMLSHMIIPYLGFSLPVVFGTGLQPLSCVHISDLSNMYIHALYTNFNNYYQALQGRTTSSNGTNVTSNHESAVIVYNAVMQDMITFQQFVSYLNAKTNLFYLPLIPMSYRLAKIIFGKERAQLLCEGQYVSPTRFMQENFQFNYPNLHSVVDEVVSK
ncbi:hypothetical protein FDP41_001872 [Naegleria fowleri]|uniref:NAD-dependent epimerase/dehydratase domain-containing protein n=1 Tax=Naegleria fowleri TaxID=5763 RepID=A0A6A5BW00_NAEFO|nr:uncharacterized protein FDP41_001872 [Naegleria fowleri]KAF0978802.1 hypothetical protein FDP41_001872 [Naegleria fowleri]